MEQIEKERVLHFYCDNQMRQLKLLSDGVLKRLGRDGENDKDEYYSIANMELFKAVETYDPDNIWGATFKTFLSTNLLNKFRTEMTSRTRKKRFNGVPLVYLDEKVSGLDEITIKDTLSSDIDIENQIIGGISDEVEKYLNSLSPKQRQLAEYVMDGYSIGEAALLMNLSKPKVDNMLKLMRRYEKRGYFNNVVIQVTKGESNMGKTTTSESYKDAKYSVDELYRKISNGIINLDHPLQRSSGQWDNKTKSNLISDILQGNPIPPLILAEQISQDDVQIIFNLDGKQRCTTTIEFLMDSFRISKNVTQPIITYQVSKKDKDGKLIFNEKGYPIFELVEFDISNKKFSQLPIELQNKFKDYNYNATLYLHCSDDEISYHIQRYNQGKGMNIAQKSFTHLGEDYARMVKAITNMPLFQDSGFTCAQYNNGSINRVIIETVMATYFLNDWKKSPEEIAIFLNKNATMEMFENVEDDINRIYKVINKRTAEKFDLKNTFLWLTLFARFKKYNVDDKYFNDFLMAFDDGLEFKKVGENTYYTIDTGKNTKDKSVLVSKLEHLEILLYDYLVDNKILKKKK